MSSEVNKLAFGDNTYTIADEVARQAINGLQTAIDTSKDVIVKGKDPLVINANKDDITVSPGSYTSITVAGLGEDFTANNIAFGKTIGLTTGVFTAYGTATAEDIAKGKVAYVKGEEIVGTLEQSSGDDGSATSLIQGDIVNLVNSTATKVRYNLCANCDTLTTVELNNVTEIGSSAFNYCYNLTSVKIPKILKLGDQCFNNCSKLTQLDIATIEQIGSRAFYQTMIKTLVLPNLITLQGGAFSGMSNVTKIDIGNSFTGSIYASTFQYDTTLTTVILRKSTSIVTMGATGAPQDNPFLNSGILNDGGYIYVPSTLVDTYKTNSAWLNYVNADKFRAIEDYPDICG